MTQTITFTGCPVEEICDMIKGSSDLTLSILLVNQISGPKKVYVTGYIGFISEFIRRFELQGCVVFIENYIFDPSKDITV